MLIKRIKRPGYQIHTVIIKDSHTYEIWKTARGLVQDLNQGLHKHADGTWTETNVVLLF